MKNQGQSADNLPCVRHYLRYQWKTVLTFHRITTFSHGDRLVNRLGVVALALFGVRGLDLRAEIGGLVSFLAERALNLRREDEGPATTMFPPMSALSKSEL